VPFASETAYPRLKSSISDEDLNRSYAPTADDLALASQVAKGTEPKICFLVLLKTFQRLGYFIQLHDVPRPIAEHVSLLFGVHYDAVEWAAYDESGTRRRHVAAIREHLGVKPFDQAAQRSVDQTLRSVAQTREDLSDLVNAAIEDLIRRRYELPGFRTLLDAAREVRTEINRQYFAGVRAALGSRRRELIDELLMTDDGKQTSLWQAMKIDRGAATLAQFRQIVTRLRWLKTLELQPPGLFADVPPVKVRHFAREALSLDAGRMLEMEENKRLALAAALVQQQAAWLLDDLGEMVIRRMRKIHARARQALADYLWQHQPDTDQLISLLQQLLLAWRKPADPLKKAAELDWLIGDRADQLLDECRAHAVHADRNYLPFLWQFYQSHRPSLFAVLEEVEIRSTAPGDSLQKALDFFRSQRVSKKEWLPLPEKMGLDWAPDKWWALVTGNEGRHKEVTVLSRRYGEMCAFTELARALQNGDIAIAGSEKFADYREQFISPEEYEISVQEYCLQTGLATEKGKLVGKLRERLAETAIRVDEAFPENECLRIEDGEPVLRRLEKQSAPPQLKQVEMLMGDTLAPVNILDALADTEGWLNWTRFFGPLSGHEDTLDDPVARYVTAVFSYGCNLGPSQTARSLTGADRRRIGWINQRHITEEALDEAITCVINGYNRFRLPGLWGSGQTASADGTKWDLYEQNLLSEYHIRYGGYGGIGYYHISDNYIALFSHFIPCGVREAVFILDGLLEGRSDIEPDTVHSDSHGQTAVVFGLAYLLGVRLMPRIRNWKELDFCRPGREVKYQHIDVLFGEAADWKLIEENLDEMLRVAISIKAGRLLSSTLLRRLGSYSRHNRLHQAFRELGRIVRTEFLLNYVNDLELRRMIQAAMNKSERFNQFTQWVAFGNKGVVTENDRVEQKKRIKYNHLVANCLIFHNVYAMTQALHKMAQEGVALSEEALRHLSPYLTEHVNRFGVYEWNPQRQAPAINYGLPILQTWGVSEG